MNKNRPQIRVIEIYPDDREDKVEITKTPINKVKLNHKIDSKALEALILKKRLES